MNKINPIHEIENVAIEQIQEIYDDLHTLDKSSVSESTANACSVIDENLTYQLKKKNLSNKQLKQLNNLDKKADKAYRVGIINSTAKGAITAIRKIRNKFEHDSRKGTFSDVPKIMIQKLEEYYHRDFPNIESVEKMRFITVDILLAINK
jgi:hypothetical protein